MIKTIKHQESDRPMVELSKFQLTPNIYNELKAMASEQDISPYALMAEILREKVITSNPEKYGEYIPLAVRRNG